jgi:flagellar hook-length control protein FliK
LASQLLYIQVEVFYMNANAIKIDVLPLPQANPARNNSAQKANRSDDSHTNDSYHDQIMSQAVENDTAADNRKHLNSDEVNQTQQASPSDNANTPKPVKSAKDKNSSFKKVLNRHIDNSQTSQDNQIETEQASQVQTDNAEAVQVTENAPLQNPANDTKQVTPQTNQIPAQPQAQSDSESPAISQLAAQAQTANVQDLQNNVIISENTQAEKINNQPSAITQPQVIKQPQVQNQTNTSKDNSQIAAVYEMLQNTGSNTDNADLSVNQTNQAQNNPNSSSTISMAPDSQPVLIQPQNVVSNQPLNQAKNDSNNTSQSNLRNDSASQNKPDVFADLPVHHIKTVSAGINSLANQNKLNADNNSQTVAQPQSNSADLPKEASTVNTFNDYISASAAKVQAGDRQQSQTESQAHNQANHKNYAAQSNINQSGPQSSSDTNTAQNLTANFDKVQVEISSPNDNQSQQQTSGLASQPVTAQSVQSPFSQIINETPVVHDRPASQPAQSSAQDNAASVREQIQMSVQNSLQQGARQITIHLNPPELGRVSIKFVEKAGELTGTIETSNSQTRADIQQALPDILRSLDQSGISIKRIDVSLSDLSRQPNQDFSRNNNTQAQWDQLSQNSYNDGGTYRFSQSAYSQSSRWSSSAEYAGINSSDYNSLATADDSLNVLI